jgi:hypothetical protein
MYDTREHEQKQPEQHLTLEKLHCSDNCDHYCDEPQQHGIAPFGRCGVPTTLSQRYPRNDAE